MVYFCVLAGLVFYTWCAVLLFWSGIANLISSAVSFPFFAPQQCHVLFFCCCCAVFVSDVVSDCGLCVSEPDGLCVVGSLVGAAYKPLRFSDGSNC